MPISSMTTPISQKDTPSSSEITKKAYHFSILNHIERILNNPYLRNHMYFGAGIETSNKRELWHGTIWHESPLFGSTTMSYDDGENNNMFVLSIYHYTQLGLFKSYIMLENSLNTMNSEI